MQVAPDVPLKWEKIYVFISSTFNDMHAERDYLVKRVFPDLREWCEQRKLRLIDIDLRWGVTEQDALYNKNVVKVCLDRIDEIRDWRARRRGHGLRHAFETGEIPTGVCSSKIRLNGRAVFHAHFNLQE